MNFSFPSAVEKFILRKLDYPLRKVFLRIGERWEARDRQEAKKILVESLVIRLGGCDEVVQELTVKLTVKKKTTTLIQDLCSFFDNYIYYHLERVVMILKMFLNELIISELPRSIKRVNLKRIVWSSELISRFPKPGYPLG